MKIPLAKTMAVQTQVAIKRPCSVYSANLIT